MVDASSEMDLREFCAKVLREYEEVIATLIERPSPTLPGCPVAIDAGIVAAIVGKNPDQHAGPGLPAPITEIAA